MLDERNRSYWRFNRIFANLTSGRDSQNVRALQRALVDTSVRAST